MITDLLKELNNFYEITKNHCNIQNIYNIHVFIYIYDEHYKPSLQISFKINSFIYISYHIHDFMLKKLISLDIKKRYYFNQHLNIIYAIYRLKYSNYLLTMNISNYVWIFIKRKHTWNRIMSFLNTLQS